MDNAEKERILLQFDRAIRAAVNRAANFRSHYRIREAAEDCLQHCRMEVWKALDRFREDGGHSLKNFIYNRARYSALDFVRENRYFTNGGSRTGRVEDSFSLATKTYGESSDETIQDAIADADYEPPRKQNVDIDDLINCACGSYRKILRRYFIDRLKMREIADEMGVGESRASQLISEGLATAKHRISQEFHFRGKLLQGGNGDSHHGTDEAA